MQLKHTGLALIPPCRGFACLAEEKKAQYSGSASGSVLAGSSGVGDHTCGRSAGVTTGCCSQCRPVVIKELSLSALFTPQSLVKAMYLVSHEGLH